MEALPVPSHQNLKRRALPEDPRTNDIGIEYRLDRHFDLRVTLAMADFNCAFLIPSVPPGVTGHKLTPISLVRLSMKKEADAANSVFSWFWNGCKYCRMKR